MKHICYLTLVLLLQQSCTKQENSIPIIDNENLIIGTWVNSQYTDTSYTVTRSTDFVEDQDGFTLKSDGTFIQRANSGWCGTPPISYANYPGTWTKFPDNKLFIETEFWGGVTSYEMEILDVNNEKMIYRLIYNYK